MLHAFLSGLILRSYPDTSSYLHLILNKFNVISVQVYVLT